MHFEGPPVPISMTQTIPRSRFASALIGLSERSNIMALKEMLETVQRRPDAALSVLINQLKADNTENPLIIDPSYGVREKMLVAAQGILRERIYQLEKLQAKQG